MSHADNCRKIFPARGEIPDSRREDAGADDPNSGAVALECAPAASPASLAECTRTS